MINPFVICNADQQAVLQAYIDREKWEIQCCALGVSLDQLRAYDYRAQQYAMTTPYANSLVVAYARRVAREALMRGEAMPDDPKQAIHDAELRDLARLIGRADR